MSLLKFDTIFAVDMDLKREHNSQILYGFSCLDGEASHTHENNSVYPVGGKEYDLCLLGQQATRIGTS